MEESELHHDRPPLAGVVRELESLPAIDKFLATSLPSRTKQLRQAIGVTVRMVMERLGWKKTGKKGSLGVRNALTRPRKETKRPHNTGGLAFWFLRAEHTPDLKGSPICQCARVQKRTPAGVQTKPSVQAKLT